MLNFDPNALTIPAAITSRSAAAGPTTSSPTPFRNMRPFRPAFMQQRRKIKLRFGRRFFEAMIVRPNWACDAQLPFEAVRIWDPGPDHDTVTEALTNRSRRSGSGRTWPSPARRRPFSASTRS
jgi:hypothetical protein